MQSAFAPKANPAATGSNPYTQDVYNLLGLNMSDPDQEMPSGETPYTINSRMRAREFNQNRVAIRERFGTSFNTAPIGETLDKQNVATVTGDTFFSTTTIQAQPWTPLTSGSLTRLDIAPKRGTSPTGHVMVEVRRDSGGHPGTLIAASSILGSAILSTYSTTPVYLIDAPTVSTLSTYWILLYIQDNGSGTYAVQTTAAAGGLVSTDGLSSWTATGSSFRFGTYISASKGVRGYTRRNPSDLNKRTIFAVADKLYAATDTGVVTQIDSGLSASASATRFENIDDKTIYVDGVTNPRWWDGTTPSDITGALAAADGVIAHQNRLFFRKGVYVVYSELYDFVTYPSVNFFYVPNPKSADPVTGWCRFTNNLIIFTHSTKHIVRGSDISTFQRDEAVGTKGAVSQEAIAVDHNFVYFMAPDGMVYRWNGVDDEPISEKMQPEFNGIGDLSKVRLDIYRNQLRVYYAQSPDVSNNRMALYDIAYKQWFMDTGRPVVGSMSLVQDNNQLLEFSSLVGQVFNGESSNFSDLGKPIDFKYWTNYQTYGYRRRTGETFGGASAKKRVRRFHPLVRTDDSDYVLSVGRDFDFANSPRMRAYVVAGGGAKWGSFVWGDGTKYGRKRMVDTASAMTGRGKYVQYRFERRGVETPPEIYGYVAQLKIGRQK